MGVMVQGSHFKFLNMPLTESCSSMGKLGITVGQQGFPSIPLTLTRMCVCVCVFYLFFKLILWVKG